MAQRFARRCDERFIVTPPGALLSEVPSRAGVIEEKDCWPMVNDWLTATVRSRQTHHRTHSLSSGVNRPALMGGAVQCYRIGLVRVTASHGLTQRRRRSRQAD